MTIATTLTVEECVRHARICHRFMRRPTASIPKTKWRKMRDWWLLEARALKAER